MSRVALVTGGSRGIGRAIAIGLKAAGYRVAIGYRENTPDIDMDFAASADLANAAECAELVKKTEAALGPVEILVNNAGVLIPGDLDTFNPQAFELMRKINVDGLVNVTRAVVPGMKERQWGRIVNLTSIAAHGTAFSGTTFYSMTKSAVSTFTRRLAYDIGSFGITVNAIAPGFIMTDMVTQGRTEAEAKEILERMSGRAMMRRVGKPEDIAAAVKFLVGDDAGFITAQVITVDGGRMDYIAHP